MVLDGLHKWTSVGVHSRYDQLAFVNNLLRFHGISFPSFLTINDKL